MIRTSNVLVGIIRFFYGNNSLSLLLSLNPEGENLPSTLQKNAIDKIVISKFPPTDSVSMKNYRISRSTDFEIIIIQRFQIFELEFYAICE